MESGEWRVESGEWREERECVCVEREQEQMRVQLSTPKFDMLQWWESLKECLPHMY